ncbi:unnamed protein product, partial [Linum tenue]
HLKIDTDPISCILLLFLNSTSSLQSLVVRIVRDIDLDEERDEASIVWVSDLAYSTPERPLSSLEEIEITEYKGGVHEFEMLAYLLEIGVALKKFTVSVVNHDLEIEEFARQLKLLQRGSSACEFLILRQENYRPL